MGESPHSSKENCGSQFIYCGDESSVVETTKIQEDIHQTAQGPEAQRMTSSLSVGPGFKKCEVIYFIHHR